MSQLELFCRHQRDHFHPENRGKKAKKHMQRVNIKSKPKTEQYSTPLEFRLDCQAHHLHETNLLPVHTCLTACKLMEMNGIMKLCTCCSFCQK